MSTPDGIIGGLIPDTTDIGVGGGVLCLLKGDGRTLQGLGVDPAEETFEEALEGVTVPGFTTALQ